MFGMHLRAWQLFSLTQDFEDIDINGNAPAISDKKLYWHKNWNPTPVSRVKRTSLAKTT
jgi:hypothetical protein